MSPPPKRDRRKLSIQQVVDAKEEMKDIQLRNVRYRFVFNGGKGTWRYHTTSWVFFGISRWPDDDETTAGSGCTGGE
jgi:hypothetical protein